MDAEQWQADNPANIVLVNAERIRNSGIAIYLECGDEDLLNLHWGTEFLHRILWDQQIPHEYRLVRWADHLGPSIPERLLDAHSFLAKGLTGGRLAPRDVALTDAEVAYALDFVNGVQFDDNATPVYDPLSDSGPAVLQAMFAPSLACADKVIAASPKFKRFE